MKNHTLFWHIGLAFLLLLVPFFLYTAFAKYLPFPEDSSPFLYAAATLFCFWSLSKLKGTSSFWGYIWIPILALFGFLEEISYGMELGWYKPFTVGNPDLLFQDFHNFVHIFIRWVEAGLGLGEWNSDLFGAFLWIDLIVIVFWFLWLAILRSNSYKLSTSKWKDRVFRFAFISSGIVGLACAVWLFVLPADPKNAAFMGLSLARLAEIFFVLGSATLTISVYRLSRSRRRPPFSDIFERNATKRKSFLVFGLLFFGLAAGFLYQIIASFTTSPEEMVLIGRVTPLVSWLIAQSGLCVLAAAFWRQHLRKAWSIYAGRLFAFFTERPPLVYTVFAIALLFFAQALDRDYFFLPNTGREFTGVLARDWHVWTEESFELIAAIQLAVASYFFPKLTRQKSKR
jgi:hypothetical protein